MKLNEDFKELYNYSHPHIENINEDTLKKIVIDIYSSLTVALDSNEIELSYIKNLLEKNGLSIMDDKVIILKDIKLKYDFSNNEEDDYELTEAWKKSSNLLESDLKCTLNWDADGYFYIRDKEFINNCIKVNSKSDIFEELASNLDNNLEHLVAKYEASLIKEDKKEVIEDIIKSNSDNNDISKFFSFKNSTSMSTLYFVEYLLIKALEAN